MAPPAVSKASHGESYSPLLLSYRWQRRNKFFECFRQKQSEKTNLSHVSFIETFSSFKFGSYWIYFCWLLLKLVAGFWDGGREGRYKNPTPQKFVHHYKVSGKPTDCRVPDLLELNSTFSPDSSSQNYSPPANEITGYGEKNKIVVSEKLVSNLVSQEVKSL